MSTFNITDAQSLCSQIRNATTGRTDDDGQALYALADTLLTILRIELRDGGDSHYTQGRDDGIAVIQEITATVLGTHATYGGVGTMNNQARIAPGPASPNCPAWCRRHVWDFDGVEAHEVTFGQGPTCVSLSVFDGQPPELLLDEPFLVPLSELRTLLTNIAKAAHAGGVDIAGMFGDILSQIEA